MGPSVLEQAGHLFFGNQSDTDLADRSAAAQAFRDPLVKQYLSTHEDALKAAESDPVNYAKIIQTTPGFVDFMKTAQANHANIVNNGNTINGKPVDNPAVVAKNQTVSGVPADTAHAAAEPHAYTRDEYIKAMSGVTTKQAELLFGQQLAHVATPAETLTKDFFTRQGQAASMLTADREALEAAETAAAQKENRAVRETPAIMNARKAEQQKWNEIAGFVKPLIGVEQRPYAMPPPGGG